MADNIHPVISLILERAKNGSMPLKRRDPHKLGLVIEGGGMRGVVSAGMVTALEYLGLRNTFDAVYGSSGGSINGAFFLAEQAAYGTTIYYENINNNNFVKNFLGILIGLLSNKRVMNLEFLLNHVMIKEKVLDWKKVITSPIPLKVVASSLEERKSKVLENFSSRLELFEALRAGATIPIVAGPPVTIKNERLWDASFYESIPVKTAKNDGCTHIFALLTRPGGELRGRPSFVEKNLIARRLLKFGKGLDKEFLERPNEYEATINQLNESKSNPQKPLFLFPISTPRGTSTIGQMERRREKLVGGAILGLRTVLSTFLDMEPFVTEVIFPFTNSGYKPTLND